jgi:hypothetical protein
VVLLGEDELINVLLAFYFLVFESLGNLKHCNSVKAQVSICFSLGVLWATSQV